MPRPTALLLAAITALALPHALLAQEAADKPTATELKPQRVTLFKNGFGVVTGKATLPDKAGPARIAPLPQATLGSLWLGWDGETRISDITARHAEVTENQPAASIPEMLRANVGNEVELMVGNEWITGTLRAMPQREPQPQPRHRHNAGNIIFPPPRPVGNTLLLDTEGGLVVLQANTVQRVQLPKDAPTEFAQTTEQPVLDFTVDQPGEDKALWVEYMAQGIAWSPSYRVDITDDKKARITAKAVIVNDLIDLDGVDVELVTGYPHLEHAHRTSGLWMASLREFLNGLRNDQSRHGRVASNIMAQQAFAYARSGAETGGIPTAPVGGQATEDLYFYPLRNVTLAEGERGYFPIFTESVPYEHCYTWDIPDYIDDNNRYRNNNNDDKAEIIWHAISLTNTTRQPWTTAPGQTVKDSRLLGQDTLHYTAVGAPTDLRITQALAIEAEQNEFEIERQRDAERFHGSRYDKVTVRGELALTNRKGQDVTVRITKQLTGEVVSADGKPKVHKLGTGLRKVNPSSELVWTVPVEADPDKPVKLSYRYTVFVRN